MLFSDVGHI